MRTTKGLSVDDKLRAHGWNVVESGCWEWRGYTSGGYGRIYLGGKVERAHRVAYETWVGPIPPGMVVRHKVCDNPPCINPEHLLVGTQADNMTDRDMGGRRIASRGSASSSAKLTDQEAANIRNDYAGGLLTQYMLAAVYGVSQGTIGRVVRNIAYTP